MKKVEKFLVASAFVVCFAVAIALVIDVCGYVKTTGKVVSVEATSVGDYRVTYAFETEDGVAKTAYNFAKNAPEVGDTAVIRYERKNPIFIIRNSEIITAYIALGMFGVAVVGCIGKAIYDREARLAAEYEEARRKRGAA